MWELVGGSELGEQGGVRVEVDVCASLQRIEPAQSDVSHAAQSEPNQVEHRSASNNYIECHQRHASLIAYRCRKNDAPYMLSNARYLFLYKFWHDVLISFPIINEQNFKASEI